MTTMTAPNGAIALRETNVVRSSDAPLSSFPSDQIDLIKRTICKESTDDELQLFLHVAKRCGLDPLAKQIHAVKRWSEGRMVMAIQTGIDGYRLIADRTNKYMPGREPTFSYDENRNLLTATAYVKKYGPDNQWHEVPATAHYWEYVGTKKSGEPNNMWATKPHIMLGKCAEALALRKAFPAELSGIYTSEEMDQAGPPEPASPPRRQDPSNEPVIRRTETGDPDLSDEPTFLHEWQRAAVVRGFTSVRALDFIKAAVKKCKTRDPNFVQSVEWREATLRELGSGALDKFANPSQKAPANTTAAPSSQPASTSSAQNTTPPPSEPEVSGEGSDNSSETVEEEEPALPATIPQEARTTTKWIDDLIPRFKPKAMTAHAARKSFHAADLVDWEKLGTVRQQEKYVALMDGSFAWKK